MRAAIRTILAALILAVLVATSPAALAQDATGSWQGSYSFSIACGTSSGQSSGSATGYFTQSNNQVTGVVLLSNFTFLGDQDCKPVGNINFSAPLTGTVSGTSFTGSIGLLGASTFSGTVSGSSMTITVAGTDTNGSITLSRTSTTAPTTTNGPLSGSYTSTDKYDECPNSITYSGGLSGTTSQTGAIFTAAMTASDVNLAVPDSSGNCIGFDIGPLTFTLFGQINGSSVTGSFFGIGLLNFSGTISGNTISGTAQSVPSDLAITSNITLSFTFTPGGPAQGTPKVVLSSFPIGMLQPAGSAGATDSFSVTNVGDAQTTVTLTQTASYFTVSPATFNLPAGQTQVVTIVAKAQPAGAFNDTITVSGSGVPSGTTVFVRLLSAAPPKGTVNASATVARVESVSAANVTPTGSIEFTNSGNDTLQGIVVADVPWFVPQSGIVTIPPGGKATVNFTIDRSKRPDAGSLIGTAKCTVSLVFLGGGQGAKPLPLGSSGSKTTSVSLLDTVKPAVSSATPAPLAAGELALFASGMRSSDRIASDLVLANRRSATVNDMKMYGAASGTLFSKLLNVPALTGDLPSTFAAIAKNIFDINGPTAAVEMRSAQAASVVINPTQVSTPGGKTSYGTALPVLRSDSGAAASEKLFLPGVEKSSTVQTALELQEMTGSSTTVKTEFLRADGGVISTRTDPLSSFGFLEVADAVPTAASTVRITNTGSGRIAAYARVSDSTTGDAWTVIDPKAEFANASGDLIIPIFPGSSNRFVDVMVPGSASASVRVQTVGGSSRRRSVRTKSIGGGSSTYEAVSEATVDRTVNIGSQQTMRLTVDAIPAGYVRLSASSPVVASGRLVLTSGTGGAFGTALPAIPVSAAIAINQTHRFTGIDDAGATSVSAGTPGTYRASLMLMETAGQSAKVRVTLNFTLPGGTRTTGTVTAQREFSVAASQHMLITDLAATVIGSQRANYGDLRNLQVDVDVIEGGGRVIPAAASTDNSTGDLMVRVD